MNLFSFILGFPSMWPFVFLRFLNWNCKSSLDFKSFFRSNAIIFLHFPIRFLSKSFACDVGKKKKKQRWKFWKFWTWIAFLRWLIELMNIWCLLSSFSTFTPCEMFFLQTCYFHMKIFSFRIESDWHAFSFNFHSMMNQNWNVSKKFYFVILILFCFFDLTT